MKFCDHVQAYVPSHPFYLSFLILYMLKVQCTRTVITGTAVGLKSPQCFVKYSWVELTQKRNRHGKSLF